MRCWCWLTAVTSQPAGPSSRLAGGGGLSAGSLAAPPPVMSGPSHHPDRTVHLVKQDNVNLYVNVEQDSFYKMIPVSTASQEEVFNLVNYNVTDEIDEGYSTNYSPSSKSTSSSFECESSLERADTSSNEVQVTELDIFSLILTLQPPVCHRSDRGENRGREGKHDVAGGLQAGLSQ